MTRNEYLRKYYSYGWTLIPVKKGEKRPALPHWKEYQARKPTNSELKKWFSDPDTGVGLLTGMGSGVVVVDEDSYKGTGVKSKLESPLVVKTGGGGKHFYFRYQEGISNAVNREKAIDIRGEGGFVVLPPTRHPSGNFYEWLTSLPENLNNLPTLDESFAAEIAKTPQNFQATNINDYMYVAEGERNDSLHRIACSLLNQMREEDAYKMVLSLNDKYDPPLSPREVETTFKSAVVFVRNNPKERLREKIREQKKEERKEEVRKNMHIYSFAEASTRYDELMEKYGKGITTGYNLLDEYFSFIPQNLYMISAETHIGKTTLVLNIAGRCARAGNKVLVGSLEQGVFIIPRIKDMFGSDENLDKISLLAPPEMPRPEDFLILLEQMTEEQRPKLLIVDHLHYFQRGMKGATEDMDQLVVKTQMLANKLELPIILVAHVRKLASYAGKKRPPTMDDLKDSSSLSQIPAVVAMLHRDKNSEEAVEQGESVFKNQGVLYIYKNRIFGKTGAEPFTIYDNGEIVFDRTPNDRINPAAEDVEGDMVVGLEGII